MQDEQLLVTCAEDLRVWNFPQSLEPKRRIKSPHSGLVNTVRWNHNGQVLATSGSDGRIVLSHVTGANLGVLETRKLSSEETDVRVNGICFSSGSRYLVSGGDSRTLKLWDLRKREVIKRFRSHASEITCAVFNPSDTHIASGNTTGTIIVDNVLTGDTVAVLDPPNVEFSQSVKSICYSPFRRNMLVSGGDDGSVRIWNVNARECVAQFDEHVAPCAAVVFSPVNQFLLASVGLDKKIHFFDVEQQKTVRTVQAPEPLTTVAFKSDGYTFCVGSSQGSVFVYDLRSESTPMAALQPHRYAVADMQFQRARLPSTTSPRATPSAEVRAQGAATATASASLGSSVGAGRGGLLASSATATASERTATPRTALEPTGMPAPPALSTPTGRVQPTANAAILPSPIVTDVRSTLLARHGEALGRLTSLKSPAPQVVSNRLSLASPAPAAAAPAEAAPAAAAAGARTPPAERFPDVGAIREQAQRSARAQFERRAAAAAREPEVAAAAKAVSPAAGRPVIQQQKETAAVPAAKAEEAQAVTETETKPVEAAAEPPEAEAAAAAASAADAAAAPAAAVSGTGGIQIKLLEAVVTDAVDAKMRMVLGAVQNMHLDVLRQAHIQQASERGMVAQLNKKVAQLAEEVDQLKVTIAAARDNKEKLEFKLY